MNDGKWRQFALCRGHDRPDLWFPDLGDDPKPAIRLCRRCPVNAECLDAALRRNEAGIWGGLTYRQRRILKARRAAGKEARGEATAPADQGNHTGRVCPNCGGPVKRGTYCSRECGRKATCGTAGRRAAPVLQGAALRPMHRSAAGCTGRLLQAASRAGEPAAVTDVNVRGLVLDVAARHWYRGRDRGIPICACGRKVTDLNEHITDEVMRVIAPHLITGSTVQLRWLYGEQLPSGRVIEVYDGSRSDPRVTHERQVWVRRDWQPIREGHE